MVSKYIALVTTLIFYSCSSNIHLNTTDKAQKEVKGPNNTIQYSYLALGDSYTIGTSINTRNNYPSQLIDSLAKRNYKIDNFDLLATNGWTTTNLIDALDNALFKSKTYDIVTLLIGVNNQYQNKDFEIFESEFTTLIDRAINFANRDANKVVVISIPDYSVTPIVANTEKDLVAQEIKKYNFRKKEITKSKGVTFINITPISQLAANDNTLLASDNLHPSAKMYSLWLNEITNIIVNKLKAE